MSDRPTLIEAADDRAPQWDVLVLALIAIGTALRFLALGQQSYWVDEIRSVLMALGGPTQGWGNAVWNVHGPLHLILLKMWMIFFGEGEVATRAFSAVFGVIALPLFYRVSLPLIGSRAALYGLALLALSPFHLWYSQETRNYAMLFDVALLAVPVYLYEIRECTRRSFLGALAISLVVCLSNLTGFFVVVLFAIFALTLGRSVRYPLRRAVLLGLITAVLLSPWIIQAVMRMGPVQLGRPSEASAEAAVVRGESPGGLLSLPFTLFVFSLGFSAGPSIHELKTYHWEAARPFLYLAPVLALIAILVLNGARATWPRKRTLLLMSMWLVIPAALMLMFSGVNLKAPNPRYAIAGFAPFMMWLALGIAAIRPRIPRMILFVLVLFFFVHSSYSYFTDPYYWRPDGRTVGRLLQRESAEGDIIVSCGVPEPMEYYAPKNLFVFPRPDPEVLATEESATEWLRETMGSKKRLWYVKIDSWWGDPRFRFLRACQDAMIPDGKWDYEKAVVRRFIAPPEWAATE